MIRAREETIRGVLQRLNPAVGLTTALDAGAGVGFFSQTLADCGLSKIRTCRDYFNGDVEPEVQSLLHKYLRPGMTLYEIGANLGFFSLLAARLVTATGPVTAFEADPEIAARLRENVVRNQGR